MIVSLIVAAAKNNVIGKDNQMPWRLPDDMKYFRDKTMGHCVIMGRKNYDSVPEKFRPLPGRTNIIVTRQKDFSAPGCIVVHSIEEGLEKAKQKNESEAFIIGGGEIFRQALGMADKIYLTKIYRTFDGDVFFPSINMKEWKEESAQHFKADEKNKYDYSFVVLSRIR
jgi:dihydrofolate reductase